MAAGEQDREDERAHAGSIRGLDAAIRWQ
jgi:hypothetical protein